MDKENLTGRQKVAIFFLIIGTEIGGLILKNLSDSEIDTIFYEISRIDKVSPEVKIQVLEEFQEMMMTQDFILRGGIKEVRKMLESSLGPEKAVDVINRISSLLKHRPFDYIRRQDPEQILRFIYNEHPQTIALILSYLDAEKASLIISGLPNAIQGNVVKRIATMDRISPEVFNEVQRILERDLSSFSNEDYTSTGGIKTAVNIINNVDRSTERGIIAYLEEEDRKLAEEIKLQMFLFEDIVLLDDKSIQMTLRNVHNHDLAKALKIAEPEIKDKIFNNMSERFVSLIKEDIEFMGLVRLKDIEESQQKIVNVIRKLEKNGEIVLPRGGQEEVV